MAPSSISSTAKTSIPIASTWRTRARVQRLPSSRIPSALLPQPHLQHLDLASHLASASRALPLESLHSVNQQLSLPLVKHPPLESLHSLALVRRLRSVVVDQLSASLHNQLKTLDLDSRQQWAVAPLLLVNHLLQDRVVLLVRHHKWDRSLLSDSRHLVKHPNQRSVKHQSQHLVRLVLPGNHKIMPVRLVQRRRNPVASLKLHNSRPQALDSLQLSVQPRASRVPSPRRQADRPSNNKVPSEVHQIMLLSNKRILSAPLLSLLLASPHNPQHSKIHSAQHRSPPSAKQHNLRTTPSANPHNPPQHPTPSASQQPNNNNNHNKTKPQQQAKPPPPPPDPTPQPTSPWPTTSQPPSRTSA